MNCQIHPELPATAYCRTCGKPICDECRRDAYGTVFCAEHAPAPATASAPPPAGPHAPVGARPTGYIYSDVSPGLAFFLGWIPGVGARSEEHTSELQSLRHLVCRLLLEKKHTR